MADLETRTDRAGALAAPVDARVFEGRAARTHARGDALKYRIARRDGTIAWREEHRDAAELARIASQIVGKKFLLGHPPWSPEHGGMLSRGARGDEIGRVIGTRVDGDAVVVELLVNDERGFAAIADGVHELSLGYMCKLDASGFQRDTEVDHLALVERGRCGEACALRADSDERTDSRGREDEMTTMTECPCGDPSCDLGEHYDDVLTAKTRRALEADDFAVPGKRKLPIHDEAHVRAAMSYFSKTSGLTSEERRSAFHRIVARAKQLGIDASGFSEKWSGRLDEVPEQAVARGASCKCLAKPGNMRQLASHMPDDLQKQLDDARAEVVAQTARADQAEGALAEEKKARSAAEQKLYNAEKDLEKANASRSDASAQAVAAETARADEAVKAFETEKARADALQQEIEKVRSDEAAVRQKLVDEKVELIAQVAQLGLEFKNVAGEAVSIHKIDTKAIKLAAIKHVDAEDFSDKSNDWIDCAFAGAMKRAKSAEQSRSDAAKAVVEVRETKNPNVTSPNTGYAAEKRAADKLAAELASAWKTTPSKN